MERATARLFDAMAEEYDTLEPWYEHLYAVLHAIVVESLAVAPAGPPPRALDAGCGNGFQTAVLERLGYRTHGVDIAGRLLARARERRPASTFALASVEALPFAPASFDAVVCCGSTLSFVDDPRAALGELARVLKPGGRLLVEVEHRFSLDLAWTLASALGGGVLGYGVPLGAAWRSVTRRPREGCVVEYPGYGRLRLFTRTEVGAMLTGVGLRPRRWWGIHTVTNVIPSTVLHRGTLRPLTAALYRPLRALDARLSRRSWAARLANSLVVLADAPGAAAASRWTGPDTVAAP
jgi:SAM-dependent methyltransferase